MATPVGCVCMDIYFCSKNIIPLFLASQSHRFRVFLFLLSSHGWHVLSLLTDWCGNFSLLFQFYMLSCNHGTVWSICLVIFKSCNRNHVFAQGSSKCLKPLFLFSFSFLFLCPLSSSSLTSSIRLMWSHGHSSSAMSTSSVESLRWSGQSYLCVCFYM